MEKEGLRLEVVAGGLRREPKAPRFQKSGSTSSPNFIDEVMKALGGLEFGFVPSELCWIGADAWTRTQTIECCWCAPWLPVVLRIPSSSFLILWVLLGRWVVGFATGGMNLCWACKGTGDITRVILYIAYTYIFILYIMYICIMYGTPPNKPGFSYNNRCNCIP